LFHSEFVIDTEAYSERSKKVDAVKNKDGNVLTKEEDIRTRWKEHFSEVLNRLDPIETAEIQTEDNNELDRSSHSR
jgi:hypothetical protein